MTLEELHPDQLVSLDQLATMRGVSSAEMFRAIRNTPGFPRPVLRGMHHTEWRAGDLMRWLLHRATRV